MNRDAYERAAALAMLTGAPFETLADVYRRQVSEEAAAKIVNFADMRMKLRPDTAPSF